MKFLKRLKWLFMITSCFMLTVGLNACSGPQVKKLYDEINEKNVCRLEPALQKGALKLILEKVDDKQVAFLFSLNSLSYLTDMHVNPKVLCKVYLNEALKKELIFQAISKKWDLFGKGSQSPNNLDYAMIVMDKEKFELIANAATMDFIVQTNQDPAAFKFSKEDLKLFQQFLITCF